MYIGFTNIILLSTVLLLSPSILTLTPNQSNFYQAHKQCHPSSVGRAAAS